MQQQRRHVPADGLRVDRLRVGRRPHSARVASGSIASPITETITSVGSNAALTAPAACARAMRSTSTVARSSAMRANTRSRSCPPSLAISRIHSVGNHGVAEATATMRCAAPATIRARSGAWPSSGIAVSAGSMTSSINGFRRMSTTASSNWSRVAKW